MSVSNTTKKGTRCPNGMRKNKKTGKCENVLDNTCAICLDRIVSDNVKTKCKHNFHKKCLLGWCMNNRDKPTCPICRGDITVICKKIMPYDSGEIFRYVNYQIAEVDYVNRTYYLEQIDKIIYNPKFDVNVEMEVWNRSILYELTHNHFSNTYFKKYIEYILKRPDIIVSNELIQSLIANNNANMLKLFNEHNKIPTALKGLI